MRTWDYVIVGGGIIGCSIARQIRLLRPERSVLLLEKEVAVGAHASGRNSGVIHSGINQKPCSAKAKLCVRGGLLLKAFCRTKGIPMMEVGTVVLARTDEEGSVIRELERRANANGVRGVRIVGRDELARVEPHAHAMEALLSPAGAIVDSLKLVTEVARDATDRGVSILYSRRVERISDRGDHLTMGTSNGSDYDAKFLVNCAGLYADRVAWMMGVGRDYLVVPFRGDYYQLKSQRSHLVNSMIYPAPNLELPFLGVHLTKRTDGTVLVGPNASLAMGRENYIGTKRNWTEALQTFFNLRFLRLMSGFEFQRAALKEFYLSKSKRAFVQAARDLVPEISSDDLIRGQSGIRAQLVDRKGRLVDDFVFERTDKSFHVLNAVSPAMTSSLAFAELVTEMIA